MSSKKVWIRVQGETDLAKSVIETGKIAIDLGFSNHICQMIKTSVSELARNILKYAGSGDIIIDQVNNDGRSGIEIVAQDSGPGIADVDKAMSDHYSSSGTLGLGLPGVKRLMDDIKIETSQGKGTKVTTTKWNL
jgi:serine/threonine-protein kinase RsbT